MFYALSSVGAFTQGAQKRRREIRSERAAIREEFERWRKNNPYATAAEFHAKVKQLGSTTPGGGVALPDHYAIQQMAAENQRQKQMIEEEREREQRLRSLQLQEATSGLMRKNAITGEESVIDLLTPFGLPVNETTTAQAENILRGKRAELAEKSAKEAQRQRQMIIEGALRLTGGVYDNMTWSQKVDQMAKMYQFEAPNDIGQGPDGINVNQQANMQRSPQPDVIRAPTVQSTPTPPMSSEGMAIIEYQLSSLPSLMGNTPILPQTVEAAINAVRDNVLRGGYRSEDEFEAALAANEQIKQLREQAKDNQFNGQLDAPRDVGELHGFMERQNVPLETFLSTAANLDGSLGNLYIPAGREPELADLLLGMLSVGPDGQPSWNKKYKDYNSTELQNAVTEELERYGFLTKDKIRANRQMAMTMGADVDTFEEVTKMFDDNMLVSEDGMTAEEAIMDGRDMAERESRQKENIQLLQYYKAVAMNGSSVDRYSLNMFDPSDILPPEEQQRYAAEIEAYFDNRIAQLQGLDLKKGTMSTDDQNNESKETARATSITDSITAVNAAPVKKAGAEALLEMGGYGFDLEPGNLVRREDGEIVFGNPFQPTLLEEQLRSDNAPIIASAIKAALLTYLSYDAPMPDATGIGVVTSSANRAMTNWRTRTEAAKDAAEQYMIANGIDSETAKTLAQNNAHLHSQIFIRNSAPLSDQEAKDLLALLDAQEAKPDYEVIITK